MAMPLALLLIDVSECEWLKVIYTARFVKLSATFIKEVVPESKYSTIATGDCNHVKSV